MRALGYAKQDRLFRRVLISWMLLGFGNLMMLPLRVEYLANPKSSYVVVANHKSMVDIRNNFV